MVIYDDKYTCPKCGNLHEIIIEDSEDYIIYEVSTKCKCGHTDYWAFGFYNLIGKE